MKKKIIVFILTLFFLFLPLSKKNAALKQSQSTFPTPQSTLVSPSNNNSFNALTDLLKIMLGAKNEPAIQVTPDVNNLIYYPQCDGPYDNYPLPQGGTLCQAGCGPTTVAMIVASYIDRTVNPKIIVEKYHQNYLEAQNQDEKKYYYLGTAGSNYLGAINILKSYGIKTANIFANAQPKTIDELMSQIEIIIKNYQAAGWTFFALANFCNEGCRHYFWITKIDDNLDTWAYDPYYGRNLSKPYNEKTHYPFPKYQLIIGVKK
jgi:hypothetical protein